MAHDNNRIPFDEDNYTHNINKNNERSLDRRGFMKTLVGAAGLFAVSSLPWGGVAAKELMKLGDKEYPKHFVAKTSHLKVGDTVEFAFPSEHDSALLIKLGENNYKAYQNACTHLRCPVFFDGHEENLICPCHHGKFDVKSGVPIAGPPRRPLPEIVLKEEHGSLYAVRVKRYEA